jgi:hypothetical protein
MRNLAGNPKEEALLEWKRNVAELANAAWLVNHREQLVDLTADREAYIVRWEKELPNMIEGGMAKKLMINDIAKNRDWIKNDIEIKIEIIDECLNK